MSPVLLAFDRFRVVRWALAGYLLVWVCSLQGLLLVSLVEDGSHRAVVSVTNNQLRLVFHHHGFQDEHEPSPPSHHRGGHNHGDEHGWSEMAEDVPPDHGLSLVHQEQHPRGVSVSVGVPIAKAVAVLSLAIIDESTVAKVQADQIDPYQFVLSTALRSYRSTVLLI